MSTRAAIYARISSDREKKELGVERQVRDCKALAERLGFDVAKVYVENDTSASTRSRTPRPLYTEMMERTRAGEFDAILAYSHSRLTRRPRENEDLIELAEKHNVRVSTVASGEYDLNRADGRATARTLAAWDTAEAERTAERVKAASDDREANGHYHGGTVPYGYRVVAGTNDKGKAIKTLEPEPDEVAVIEEAIGRLFSGDTISGIVKDWQRQGRTTRNAKIWRVTGLRPILRNPMIVGKNKFGDVVWPPIIEQATFDRLQAIFDDPARRTTISPGVKGGKYSLSGGILKCGECGHTLTSYTRGEERDKRGGFRCAPHTGGKGCVSVDFERLERYVFETVAAVLNDSERWRQRSTIEQAGEVKQELSALDARAQELDDQARRATDAYVEGLTSREDHGRRVRQILEQRAEVERRRAELMGTSQIERAMSEGLDWTSWTPERRRNFLRLALDSIVVSVWPTDVPKGLPKRRTETAEQHRTRFERGQREALIKRVQINWKD